MAFEGLTQRLAGTFKKLKNRGKLNDRYGGAPEIDRCARSIIQLANQLDED